MTSTLSIVDIALKRGVELCGTLFDDPDEVHAFEYGVLAGWRSSDPNEKFDTENIPVNIPEAEKAVIHKEYPYYNAGWTIGWAISNRNVQIGGAVITLALAVGKYLGIF